MDLENQNAKYIQQINQNLRNLDQNVNILEQQITAVNEAVKNLARDIAAMQRAIIEYLREKEIIKDDDDLKLLQRSHLRHIAALDQEIEERKRREIEEKKKKPKD